MLFLLSTEIHMFILALSQGHHWKACMWLVTSLNLEGQEWGCWHRGCACFRRLLRQSRSFCLFFKDITKWCPCIFHFCHLHRQNTWKGSCFSFRRLVSLLIRCSSEFYASLIFASYFFVGISWCSFMWVSPGSWVHSDVPVLWGTNSWLVWQTVSNIWD